MADDTTSEQDSSESEDMTVADHAIASGELEAPETKEEEEEQMDDEDSGVDGDDDADDEERETAPDQDFADMVARQSQQQQQQQQTSAPRSPPHVVLSADHRPDLSFIPNDGDTDDDQAVGAGRLKSEEFPLEHYLEGMILGDAAEAAPLRPLGDHPESEAAQDRRRLPTRPVIPPLDHAWEERVREAMDRPAAHAVASTSKGQTITRRDLGTLVPAQFYAGPSPWLNDEIINAYLQAVVDLGNSRAHELPAVVSVPAAARSASSSGANHHHPSNRHHRHQRPHQHHRHRIDSSSSSTAPPPSSSSSTQHASSMPRYHFFNTYFFPKIRDQGPASVSRWLTRAKLDPRRLLEMERIFIPVHQGAHWTLLVVSPRFRTIEYFDSLDGGSAPFVRVVKRWLAFCLQEDWIEEDWTVPSTRSPVQENGYDCGVFTVTTARMITLGIDPMAYSQQDIPLQRRRIAAELINGGLHGDFDPAELHD